MEIGRVDEGAVDSEVEPSECGLLEQSEGERFTIDVAGSERPFVNRVFFDDEANVLALGRVVDRRNEQPGRRDGAPRRPEGHPPGELIGPVDVGIGHVLEPRTHSDQRAERGRVHDLELRLLTERGVDHQLHDGGGVFVEPDGAVGREHVGDRRGERVARH